MLMKLKRLFAGIMSAAIALSLFGCASTTETADTQGEGGASQQAEDTSWTDVQEAGKIVIGVDDQFPPMGFRDDSGEIVGFDIDLANAVCEKLGVQAEIKPRSDLERIHRYRREKRKGIVYRSVSCQFADNCDQRGLRS